MAVFTVHEPPDPPSDRMDRAESLVFVGDGFSWSAALVPPLWLASVGDWLGLVLYAVAAGTLGGLLYLLGATPGWIALALASLHVLLGFEAGEFRRFALSRRGYTEVGAVSGRTAAECERRFFDGWLAEQPVLTAPGGATQSLMDQPPRATSVPSSLWQRLTAKKT